MKKTVTLTEFYQTFDSSDLYRNNFSHRGLIALWDYLNEFEDSMGEEIKFDVVGLCCSFCEFESLEELAEQRMSEGDLEGLSNDEKKDFIRNYVEERATLIEFRGGIIVTEF